MVSVMGKNYGWCFALVAAFVCADIAQADYSVVPMDNAYICEKNDPEHRWAHTLNQVIKEFAPKIESKDFANWNGLSIWLKRNPHTLNKVKYLSPEESEDIIVRYDKALAKFVNAKTSETFEKGMVMYVMDKKGTFYLHKKMSPAQHTVGMNHSSLLAGEPVASVGFFHFDDKGTLIALDNYSGHYKPQDQQIVNGLKQLQSLGIDLRAINLRKRIGDTFDNTEHNAEIWLNEHE